MDIKRDMKRKYLNFEELDECDKEWFLNETWCDICDKADLGLKEPSIYVEAKKTFIEGKCSVCSNPVISEIITKEISE
jgi:hypothetical protein